MEPLPQNTPITPRALSPQEIEHILAPWLKKEYTLQGQTHSPITQLTDDSRKVSTGALFVAVTGTDIEGWNFLEKALQGGANYIVGEHTPTDQEAEWIHQHGATLWVVTSSREALAALAQAYWHNAGDRITLVGVTGTNGKTSTVTMLHQLFTNLGFRVGLIGTVAYRIGKESYPSTHTTPGPLQLAELLYRMYMAGCSHVFMEVSSHAIHQNRIGGLRFTGALFTNLTRDHLDYHGTMANYLAAKKSFFNRLSKEAFALVNADDSNGTVMLQNCSAKHYTYALKTMADFKARIVEGDLMGTELWLQDRSVWVPLVGVFNAYNVTLVYAASRLLLPTRSQEEILQALSTVHHAEGRFQLVRKKGRTAIVDYAHTPDALIKVLDTVRPLVPEGGRVITVVGAGGNRDRGKRPLMAQEAFKRSDVLILTSDNPRHEEPQTIIDEMLQGLSLQEQSSVICNADRRSAIRTACLMATPKDVVVIAGKGHETYQEINGIRHHFSDVEELEKALDTIYS